MKFKIFTGICLLFWVTSAKADIVTNGGFETGDFSGWTLSGDQGCSGVRGTTGAYLPCGYSLRITPSSGNYAAALGSDTYGSISQTLTTTPFTSYVVSFELADCVVGAASCGGATFEVDWDGTALSNQTDLAAFPYTRYSFTAIATGTSTLLQFNNRNYTNWFFLDDVSVTPVTASAVPEPSSLILLSSGLAGFAGITRRKVRS